MVEPRLSVEENRKLNTFIYITGFPLDLENVENESTPGKPGNIMEFWKI